MNHPPVLPVSSIRDLTLLGIDDERVLVIACDSVGSIGPKPHDSYEASATVAAHFAVRVPLLELIAAGGTPEVIVDALSVELDPTGAEMIDEVRRIAASLGLGADRVTGSTEDNVPSTATGIGVTIIGSANRSALRPGTSRADDVVLCLGQPTSAPHDLVVVDDSRMISLTTLRDVLAIDGVHDALPVGSKGIAHELEELATTAGLRVELAQHDLDPVKSGGPASCVLVSADEQVVDQLHRALPSDLPYTFLGRLRADG